jgi:hypothetical protein
MQEAVLEMHCLLCGTEVGEVRAGRFRHHAGCDRQVLIRAGSLRCCRCGGSLYQERADRLRLSSDVLAALAEQQAIPAAG